MTGIAGNLARGAALLLGVLWLAAAPDTAAQGYPARPVRLVVPFAAGGPTDVVARLIGQKLSERLGQQFIVENRPGAGGNIGMGLVAKAPPDGYTLLVASTSIAVNPSLYANAPYDPFKDFAPITCAADAPNVLTVHPSLPATTVAELIALVKSNPGRYSMATSGMGTTPHLAGELFRTTLGLDLVNAPFGGSNPALASTVQGQTPIAITSMGGTTELIKGGQLRALAVLAAKRSAALPDVPTMAEAGVRDQESDTLAGFLAPAGTPREIIDRLHREIAGIAGQPEIRQQLEQLGFDTVANTPAEFAAMIRVEVDKWGKLIRAVNIKVE
ncbi:MAG: tripartite tricarboxylate transporter substrate binding protein [Proteobacteria bacterium]|nr:tripartite tricarboxylate transporter substrate binding protein [Pseudomonadota bacterium]